MWHMSVLADCSVGDARRMYADQLHGSPASKDITRDAITDFKPLSLEKSSSTD